MSTRWLRFRGFTGFTKYSYKTFEFLFKLSHIGCEKTRNSTKSITYHPNHTYLPFYICLEIWKFRPLFAKVTTEYFRWKEEMDRKRMSSSIVGITLSLDLWEGGGGPVWKKVAEKSRILPYNDRSGEQRWSIANSFRTEWAWEKCSCCHHGKTSYVTTLIWLVSFSLLQHFRNGFWSIEKTLWPFCKASLRCHGIWFYSIQTATNEGSKRPRGKAEEHRGRTFTLQIHFHSTERGGGSLQESQGESTVFDRLA